MSDKKAIDWQVAIDSGLDCEFWDEDGHGKSIGKLTYISQDVHFNDGAFFDHLGQDWNFCRIRHNHKFGWCGGYDGVKAPIPPGVLIYYNGRYRNRREGESLFFGGSGTAEKIDWESFEGWFAVKGLEERYTWQ